MNLAQIKTAVRQSGLVRESIEADAIALPHTAMKTAIEHIKMLEGLLEKISDEGLHIKIQDLSTCPACGDDGDDVFVTVDNSGEGSAEQVVNCTCGCEYVAKFTATVDVKYDSEWVKGGPADEG